MSLPRSLIVVKAHRIALPDASEFELEPGEFVRGVCRSVSSVRVLVPRLGVVAEVPTASVTAAVLGVRLLPSPHAALLFARLDALVWPLWPAVDHGRALSLRWDEVAKVPGTDSIVDAVPFAAGQFAAELMVGQLPPARLWVLNPMRPVAHGGWIVVCRSLFGEPVPARCTVVCRQHVTIGEFCETTRLFECPFDAAAGFVSFQLPERALADGVHKGATVRSEIVTECGSEVDVVSSIHSVGGVCGDEAPLLPRTKRASFNVSLIGPRVTMTTTLLTPLIVSLGRVELSVTFEAAAMVGAQNRTIAFDSVRAILVQIETFVVNGVKRVKETELTNVRSCAMACALVAQPDSGTSVARIDLAFPVPLLSGFATFSHRCADDKVLLAAKHVLRLRMSLAGFGRTIEESLDCSVVTWPGANDPPQQPPLPNDWRQRPVALADASDSVVAAPAPSSDFTAEARKLSKKVCATCGFKVTCGKLRRRHLACEHAEKHRRKLSEYARLLSLLEHVTINVLDGETRFEIQMAPNALRDALIWRIEEIASSSSSCAAKKCRRTRRCRTSSKRPSSL
jgi:hypothetical protein